MHPSTPGARENHDRHAGHSVAMFREKFWLSLALTVPVVVRSSEVQHWRGYTAPTFPGSRWIPAILGTVVFVYGGSVFLRGARVELSDRCPGMTALISLAILVAFAASLAATVGFLRWMCGGRWRRSSPLSCLATGSNPPRLALTTQESAGMSEFLKKDYCPHADTC